MPETDTLRNGRPSRAWWWARSARLRVDFGMILTRLQLQHFRNYAELDLPLPAGSTLFYGPNGAGKTNLLEAVFALATTKSFRARSDRELIDRDSQEDQSSYRFVRLEGEAEADESRVTVEMLVMADPQATASEKSPARKRFRLNGVPKRAADVVGQIKAVLFAPSDIEIILGSPSGRRRYLDLMLCQVDASYLRLLQSYTRIVQQRNAVLNRLAPRSHPGLLDFWDQKLVTDGAELVRRRQEVTTRLSALVSETYERLSGGREDLTMAYSPSIGDLESATDVDQVFRDRLRLKRVVDSIDELPR